VLKEIICYEDAACDNEERNLLNQPVSDQEKAEISVVPLLESQFM